jgi:hypothetical protein
MFGSFAFTLPPTQLEVKDQKVRNKRINNSKKKMLFFVVVSGFSTKVSAVGWGGGSSPFYPPIGLMM